MTSLFQSDVIHQSVYELVHSEDREELQRQLMWSSFLTPEEQQANPPLTLQDLLLPENSHMLERSFTVRFRCLLDNTSGFLRLDIRGRLKVLHGQNKKTEDPPLALFCICTPFGPPSLLDIPQKEVMFKSKHKLDFSFVSMDQRWDLEYFMAMPYLMFHTYATEARTCFATRTTRLPTSAATTSSTTTTSPTLLVPTKNVSIDSPIRAQ